jgi:hypothetical protein
VNDDDAVWDQLKQCPELFLAHAVSKGASHYRELGQLGLARDEPPNMSGSIPTSGARSTREFTRSLEVTGRRRSRPRTFAVQRQALNSKACQKHWDSLQECRECMQEIRTALSDYHNRRGDPVYGMTSDGVLHEIRKASLRKGLPEGWDSKSGEWFLLRKAEIRTQ